MAVTQYIGARYVPLIYQNPDDNTNNWKQGVPYEPLTIVSYAGGSYTSKAAVPAGAANPVDAPEYWVSIGLYSGQTSINTNNISRIQHALANATEAGYVCTTARQDGDFVWIDGTLYRCTADVAVNDNYVEGINITPVLDSLKTLIDDMTQLDTTLHDDMDDLEDYVDDQINDFRAEINRPEKYIFLGDSYNESYHHGGWGSFIISQLGLTEGTDVWNVAQSGAGMANGMFLTAIQNTAATMTDDEKNGITKILISSGANDWNATEANITTGLQALEGYLISTFPNAEIILVGGEWAYATQAEREGILSAYNAYATANRYMKYINKAFLLFLDPYFLEDDMTHPTQNGMYHYAMLLKNVLLGGNSFTRFYSGLNAVINTTVTGGNVSSYPVYGDISEAGIHVFNNSPVQMGWTTPIHIGHNTATKIGEISTQNNLFEREATIYGTFFAAYDLNGSTAYGLFNGRLIVKKQENARKWDVLVASDSFLPGITGYEFDTIGIYPCFNVMLDITKN